MKNFSLRDQICGLAGLLIAVLLVMLFIALPAVADPPWSVNVRVNDPSGWNSFPAIAIDDAGNAFAAWTSTRHYPNCSIYFSYRPVEGDWSPDIQINDVLKTSCSEVYSNITADEVGNAYAIWTDRHDDSVDLDIYFSYRLAGGDWGASELVNDTPLPQRTLYYGINPPAIGVDGVGNAYAVWEDGRNDGYSNFDIYFSYRLVGGSWNPNERVNDDTSMAYQYWPDIAVDGAGNAYVVWIDQRNDDGDIYFSYRPAGGSWSPNERVNDDTGTASQSIPKITVDGTGNTYVVWIDSRNGGQGDIYFSYRPVGGNWSPNERVNDDSPGSASREVPAIAVDETGNAYAMWTDHRNGDKDIYFSYRPVGGNWSPNERGNDDTGTAYQYYSDIAVDGTGNTYAVGGDRT